MRVLGIDPASHTGIAVVESGKKVIYSEEAYFKNLGGSAQAAAITERIISVHGEYSPDLVVLESMIVGHPASAIPIIRLGSVIRYFLWQENIKAIQVNPGSLKNFVVGKGNAKKDEIMMMVLKNWGFTPRTNNIADAVGLAMFGLATLGEKFTQKQELVVSRQMATKPWCN